MDLGLCYVRHVHAITITGIAVPTQSTVGVLQTI